MEVATGCVFTLIWHLVADSIVAVQFLTVDTEEDIWVVLEPSSADQNIMDYKDRLDESGSDVE